MRRGGTRFRRLCAVRWRASFVNREDETFLRLVGSSEEFRIQNPESRSQNEDCALRRASIFWILYSGSWILAFYFGFGVISAFVRPRAHLMASKYMVWTSLRSQLSSRWPSVE